MVNPLADDPQSKEVAFERIVSPGKTARLYGSNLQNVTAILLGGNTITDPTYVESADENYLEYIVPTGVSEGDYRIVLQDADGNQYGADMVLPLSFRVLTGLLPTWTGPFPVSILKTSLL